MNKFSVIQKINEYLSQKDYISARKLIRNDLKRLGSKMNITYIQVWHQLNLKKESKIMKKLSLQILKILMQL